MTRRMNVVAIIAGVALAGSLGCTTKQAAPAVSGPSELSTSITIYASPDTLTQDGAAQSQVTVQARDANNQPIANLPIRLATTANGVLADFGQLSNKQLVTGSDGRSTVVYTAPNAAQSAADVLASVTILATPVGNDASGSIARSITIRLTQPGIVPKAVISFSPSAPLAQTDVTFSGANSTVTVGRIVGYAWDFGDGSVGTGSPVQHRFSQGGTYTVTLVVTDDRGLTGKTTSPITVTDSSAPVASFTFSPSSPVPNQTVFFNASASAGGSGRSIVSYGWDFGNGSSGSGVSASTGFGTPGNYVVTLTVTDDVGKKGTAAKTVTVASSLPISTFSFSPSLPFGGQTVNFNGTASSSPYGIASYTWDFGDGGTTTGSTTAHAYSVGLVDRSFTIRLTVTDNAGQSGSSTQTITVKAGSGLTAAFTFSPSNPVGATAVNFNASGSAGPNPITTYAWDFGDGSTGTGVIPAAHAFAGCTTNASNTTDQTFVVRLTVTDAVGQANAATQSVTVTKCKL